MNAHLEPVKSQHMVYSMYDVSMHVTYKNNDIIMINLNCHGGSGNVDASGPRTSCRDSPSISWWH